METTLLAAGVVTILVIALVVRQVVRGCARTVFAAPPEPTPEEIEASRTHKTLPLTVELDADTADIAAQACAVLTAWMQAVNSRDAAKLTGEAKALSAQLADQIAKQTQKGQRERFERPTVHDAVVSAYERETGALTVTLSAQAVHYVASGGQLIRGREDLPEQMLWELQGNLTAQGWTPTCARLL